MQRNRNREIITNYIFSNCNNKGEMYNLVFSGYFDNISSVSLFTIVDNVDNLIGFFNISFPCLINKDKYFNIIIDDVDFLLFNICNNKTVIYKKIIIKNFIENKNILENEYGYLFSRIDNNIDELFELMKDIVWCNYNQYELIYVFSNYKSFINDEKTIIIKKILMLIMMLYQIK